MEAPHIVTIWKEQQADQIKLKRKLLTVLNYAIMFSKTKQHDKMRQIADIDAEINRNLSQLFKSPPIQISQRMPAQSTQTQHAAYAHFLQ